MSMDFFKKAEELLNSCEDIEVASINEDGYPRVCVVSKLESEGFDTIFFSTGTSGTKANHFKKNSKSSVCYHDEHNSVTLVGEMEIVEDMEIKKRVWQDWMINYMVGGVNDEEFCLLKFKAHEATFWIDREFTTKTLQDKI